MAIENILWEWLLVGMIAPMVFLFLGSVSPREKLMRIPYGLVALWPMSYVTKQMLVRHDQFG